MKQILLSEAEIIMIELVYFGYLETNQLSERLSLSADRVNEIEKSIFRKFRTDCWFVIIKRAFELGVLDKEKNSILNIKKEVAASAKKILKISIAKDRSPTEIKFKIYEELINFYTKYEYSYLLRPIEEPN
ncbi:MAG: DNA-binding CsgD family transcriptional regulator [Glaciecola sp.]|jgi:DNA-binding CsgD family transcriptional regulator